MNIVILSQWCDPEPGATKVLPLARLLQERGHSVKILTGVPNYPDGKIYVGYRMRLWQYQVMDGVKVMRVPLYPSHDGNAFHRFLNYISFAIAAATIGAIGIGKAQVGFVIHPPPTIGLPALVLKYFRRIPFVYNIADMWPDTVVNSGMIRSLKMQLVAKAIISAWCNVIYRRASSITVLSPGFKRLLIERGVPAEKIHVVYHWTDEVAFKVTARDPVLAEQLGLSGKFNVIYAGNLGPMQGLETVIRAAVNVKHIPNIQIVLAGTGLAEASLKALASELGATNIRFLGRREYWEMSGINALADGLLVHLRDLSFFNATIPGKTQVSLASGRPTLMAVAGDAATLVREARAGLTCPPEDPDAMAQMILDLYSMPAKERELMGANGAEFYRREISLQVGADKTEALLLAAARRS